MDNMSGASASGADGKSKFFKGAIVLYRVLDVEAVPVNPGQASAVTNNEAGDAEGNAEGNAKGDVVASAAGKKDESIKTFVFARAPQILSVDVAIAGGGMGGVAAALSLGETVRAALTEETSWLGGQLSTQSVSALDENKYVETSGACLNYLQMRQAIRKTYRDSDKLTAAAAADPILNPGSCWVTRLAFEPQVALGVLDKMLTPQIERGATKILKRTKIVAAHLVGEAPEKADSPEAAQIDALLAVNLDSGEFTEIQCTIAIDATELGDLMPLAKIPYQTGSDSRWITGEPHAPEVGDAENVQDFTYPFILTFHPGENHTIEKPTDYDAFFADGKFSFDGYKMFVETDDIKDGKERHLLPFWTYRRLIDKGLFMEGAFQSDVSMINWDSNDLRGKNIIDKSPEIQRDYLSLGKRISLGFLYWLQTAAPRDDGGHGYPELKLNYDLLGTKDGLSKYPYIREGRRLAATARVVEQDIVEKTNSLARAKLFSDSCGIGLYPVDIHGRQEIPGAAQQTKPFQVPLGTLITDYCANYIAGCKNIGVTHITNGAYRLHPIEWAIGTAAGALARLSLSSKTEPLSFASDQNNLISLQMQLAMAGAPIFWFEDVLPTDDCFVAAQLLATIGLMPFNENTLKFEPEVLVDETEIALILERASLECAGIADWSKTLATIKRQMPDLRRAKASPGAIRNLKKFTFNKDSIVQA